MSGFVRRANGRRTESHPQWYCFQALGAPANVYGMALKPCWSLLLADPVDFALDDEVIEGGQWQAHEQHNSSVEN